MPIRRTNMDNMIETINSYAKKDGLKISSNVITAIKEVPRNLFVRKNPFDDSPQLIGWNQTISQPYIVAYMTEMLDVKPSHRVLDVGMGSGYQSAILSKLVKEVYAIEIIKELAEKTREVLQDYKNIKTGIRNGYDGWEKYHKDLNNWDVRKSSRDYILKTTSELETYFRDGYGRFHNEENRKKALLSIEFMLGLYI